MPYQIKPLSCDPAKIRGMSERLIVSHYENNYGGAVKRLNLIDEQLAELDYARAAGFLVNGLKREQLIAMNSMILHELFFDGLGDQSEPGPTLQDALAKDFGSLERWRAEFIAMGKALGGGSGWVLLSWSPRDRKLVNQWAPITATPGGTPILALDMYEHSYHSHRFRRQGCKLRRHFHAGHSLEQCGMFVRSAHKTTGVRERYRPTESRRIIKCVLFTCSRSARSR
jgi:Fe-Mn family superoxide dismutase